MDPFDAKIIGALLAAEQTVHQLSKRLYRTEDQRALRGHNSTLRYRLGRLAEDGLVRRRPGRHGTYYVPLGDLIYGTARVVVRSNGSEMSLDLGRVLVTETSGKRQLIVLE
jgi:hypothetical protein